MTSVPKMYGMKKIARNPFLNAILLFSSTARNIEIRLISTVMMMAMKKVNR